MSPRTDEALGSDEVSVELSRLEEGIARQTQEGNPEEAAALHFLAAQICLARHTWSAASEQDTSRRMEALKHLWSSWNLAPDSLDVLAVLGPFLEMDGQLAEAADLYRSTSDHIQDLTEQATLKLKAASLLRRSGEVPEALSLLGQIEIGSQELGRRRLMELQAIVEQLPPDDAPGQIEALGMLQLELEGDDRFECLVMLATLHERGGDVPSAVNALRAAVELRPGSPRAIEPIRRLLEERGAHEELVVIIERSLGSHQASGDRAAALRDLAEIVEEQLGDNVRSALLWWRVWALDGLGEAPFNLKRIYADREDWLRYGKVLERQVLCARDVDSKVEIFRELARFQQQVMKDDLAAARTHGFILNLVPDDAGALAARVRIYETRQMHQDLAAALRRQAAQAPDRAARDRLLRRLIRHQFKPPTAGTVVRILRRLDPLDASNRQIIRELRQSAELLEPAESAEIGAILLQMDRQAGAAPDVCSRLAMELVEEYTRGEKPGQAADLCRQVLEHEPDHQEALDRLAQLSRRGSLADPTPEELINRAEELAGPRPERATRLLIQAAQMSSHQPEPDRPLIARSLERAVELCPMGARTEVPLLEDALCSAHMHEEQAHLLASQAAGVESPAERKEILHALAHVYRDRLDRPEEAVEALRKVLEIDPSDLEVIEEIRALQGHLGNHVELANVLEDLLARTDGPSRIPLLEELGQLYTEELDDSASTLSRYGELLSICPNHPRALAYCKAHDLAAGDHRSVAVLLCRAAEATEDPLARAEVHRDIARIAEIQLTDLDFAITHWQQVVELCPADSAPRAELKRILGQAGRWRDVERVLLSEVARLFSPAEKVPVYCELANLSSQHLDDQRAAASYLRNALQLAPENTEALDQLGTIYERLGQWRELTTITRKHADVTVDLRKKTELLHRSARVLFVQLGRGEEALTICRQIRELNPRDRGTASLMQEIFTQLDQVKELAELMGDQIAMESDPAELGRLHLELGRLMLDRLKDSEEAAKHFEVALELDRAGGDVLTLLRQLYEELNRWDLLIELIRRRAKSENVSISERAASLCEIGRISEEHLEDRNGAQKAYEQAIHLDPGHRPALTALRALAMAGEQWRDVVALARRELSLTTEPPDRARLLVDIGEIMHLNMDRPSAAAEALEEALQNDPNLTRAAERLGMIYFDSDDWERAGTFLEQVVNSGLELENLHDFYYRLGYATERLGKEEEAFSYFVKSFGREPMYLPTLERLVDLCFERRQWDNTLRIAEAIVTSYADSKTVEQLGDLHLRIGLCELHMAQREAAVKQLQVLILEHGEVPRTPPEAWTDTAEAWAATPLEPHLLGQISPDVLPRVVKAMEHSLVHVPNHAGALQVLAAISLASGEWTRGMRYIERAAEAVPDTPRLQARLLICAGDVAYRRLLSTQRAEGYFRQALELLPGSELARDRLDMLQVTPPMGRDLPLKEPAAPPLAAIRTGPPPVPTGASPSQPESMPRGMPPIPPLVNDQERKTDPGGTNAPRPAPRPAPRSRPRRDKKE